MGEWRWNKELHSRYVHELPVRKVLVEYIYVDDDDVSVHSKCRTFDEVPQSAEDCPMWRIAVHYPVENRFLKPVALYSDPFRRGSHKLLLCDVYNDDWTPSKRNFRKQCDDTMTSPEVKKVAPWFGLEQEYTICDKTGYPIGWPPSSHPQPVDPYHHEANGTNKTFGRDLYESHLFACLYAGINISGGNAEAFPGQWEFQVGPSEGTRASDDLWTARYILYRMSEEFGLVVTLAPKPLPALNIGACGGHVNISTKPMREDRGIKHIEAAIKRLEKTHLPFLGICDPSGGLDNVQRLKGWFCTAPYQQFCWGIEDRNATIRIPRLVADDGKGYLEDRRPASNFDPYLVTGALVRIIVLGETIVLNPYLSAGGKGNGKEVVDKVADSLQQMCSFN
ncbi:glutamine synthetase 2 cytoplasmic-like [Littorina saxatilis]|uniref:glutamine synthetase n=1 Tax=Littorina saxatilis TaxID=31220 RepID=A0AAN9AWV6_9CAEN